MTTLIFVCDGSFVSDDGKKYSTHRLLLQYENQKGVSYGLEKYDAKKITSDDLAERIGYPINPLYDKYGRIVSI